VAFANGELSIDGEHTISSVGLKVYRYVPTYTNPQRWSNVPTPVIDFPEMHGVMPSEGTAEVAISDSTLAHSIRTSKDGKVGIYSLERTSSGNEVWNQKKILFSTRGPSLSFGSSVVIAQGSAIAVVSEQGVDERVIIGAPGEGAHGFVYSYFSPSFTQSERQVIDSPWDSTVQVKAFGAAIAVAHESIGDTWLAVGAPDTTRGSVPGMKSGAFAVYRRQSHMGAKWELVCKAEAPQGLDYGEMGRSLAIRNNHNGEYLVAAGMPIANKVVLFTVTDTNNSGDCELIASLKTDLTVSGLGSQVGFVGNEVYFSDPTVSNVYYKSSGRLYFYVFCPRETKYQAWINSFRGRTLTHNPYAWNSGSLEA